MKLKAMLKYFLVLFSLTFFATTVFSDTLKSSNELIKFPKGKTCAAWYSIESLIFNPRTAIAGLSCQTSTRFEKVGENFRLIADMPLSNFDSGSKGRDEFFRKALKESERTALHFESSVLNRAYWNEILNGSKKTLQGELTIGQKSFPVVFQLKHDTILLQGNFKGKYNDFGMEPHSVGPFGMIAQTENYLEILFQLDIESTDGANLIR